MKNLNINGSEKSNYQNDGYLIKSNFFSKEEIDLLLEVAGDDRMRENAMDLNDQSGGKTKLTLWFTPGDDSFGLMSRSARVVNGVQTLLGDRGKVCHFHSKVMVNNQSQHCLPLR